MLEKLPKLAKNQSGQALLIIVLVMVIALTIGLSVASRTITNVRTTTQQASSQKALSAAEAGIEQAIKNSANVAGSFTGNTTYNTTIGQVLGTSPFLLNGGTAVSKSDAIYVWLSPYTTDPKDLWKTSWNGNLTIYWGNGTGPCNNAAIEISVIKGNRNSPTMSRYGFDPCSARASVNHFTLVSSSPTTISGLVLYYRATISINQGLLVRANSVYGNASMGASGSNALPSQGNIITSVGTSDANTQRKITVFQGYPEIPTEFFPYTLFSP